MEFFGGDKGWECSCRDYDSLCTRDSESRTSSYFTGNITSYHDTDTVDDFVQWMKSWGHKASHLIPMTTRTESICPEVYMQQLRSKDVIIHDHTFEQDKDTAAISTEIRLIPVHSSTKFLKFYCGEKEWRCQSEDLYEVAMPWQQCIKDNSSSPLILSEGKASQ